MWYLCWGAHRCTRCKATSCKKAIANKFAPYNKNLTHEEGFLISRRCTLVWWCMRCASAKSHSTNDRKWSVHQTPYTEITLPTMIRSVVVVCVVCGVVALTTAAQARRAWKAGERERARVYAVLSTMSGSAAHGNRKARAFVAKRGRRVRDWCLWIFGTVWGKCSHVMHVCIMHVWWYLKTVLLSTRWVFWEGFARMCVGVWVDDGLVEASTAHGITHVWLRCNMQLMRQRLDS